MISYERLQIIIDKAFEQFQEIDEAAFSLKPSPEKWSKKEILGHLIDSAANNHHRFIRSQFEEIVIVSYNQNEWNQYNHYNELSSVHLLNFWKTYNQHLVEIIKRISNTNLNKTLKTAKGDEISLSFLVEDYIDHLEHHLSQIFSKKDL